MQIIIAAIIFMLFASPVTAITIDGIVKLKSSARKSKAGLEHTIIFYRPDEKQSLSKSPPIKISQSDHKIPLEVIEKPAIMQMINKLFDPIVMAVTTGTEVSFPNVDRVVHNAFSTTKKNEFELGFYNQGESRSYVFSEPGVVKVFCNVHQGMTGYILVLDTPYFTIADSSGSYQIENVPEGTGTVYIWHPQGKTVSRKVAINQQTVNAEYARIPETIIKLTKRLVPKHRNKFGKPYRRNRNY